MTVYRVNDIFYSLQGEGRHTGRAAVFVRFAGCNLRCPFCDTEFDEFREMTANEIVEAIAPYPARFVVLTGGEPTLQADETFVDLLHQHGYEVAMESNGTRPAPASLDWLTVSPKGGERGTQYHPGAIRSQDRRSEVGNGRMPDEIKVVFQEDTDPEAVLSASGFLPADNPTGTKPYLFLQPCDTGSTQRNKLITDQCIDYIKKHPWWRLSLQTHKLTGIE